MVARKNLSLLLSSTPYGNQYADHMCRVALRALEKGHSVEIFLIGDGVHAQMTGQIPNGVFPVGPKMQELIEKGARVHSCRISSSERGYGIKPDQIDLSVKGPSDKVTAGVDLIELSDLVNALKHADRVLSFGGG